MFRLNNSRGLFSGKHHKSFYHRASAIFHCYSKLFSFIFQHMWWWDVVLGPIISPANYECCSIDQSEASNWTRDKFSTNQGPEQLL